MWTMMFTLTTIYLFEEHDTSHSTFR